MGIECPYCAGTGELYGDDLRLTCKIRGIEVGLDDTISRKDAARLMHRTVFTLRNRALAGKTPECFKDASGRWRYPISGLEEWMAEGQEYKDF